MTSLGSKLAEKITAQQELESEIKGAKFQLDYTKFEISNIKDAIISEYENALEEKQQQIEDLESKN